MIKTTEEIARDYACTLVGKTRHFSKKKWLELSSAISDLEKLKEKINQIALPLSNVEFNVIINKINQLIERYKK